MLTNRSYLIIHIVLEFLNEQGTMISGNWRCRKWIISNWEESRGQNPHILFRAYCTYVTLSHRHGTILNINICYISPIQSVSVVSFDTKIYFLTVTFHTAGVSIREKRTIKTPTTFLPGQLCPQTTVVSGPETVRSTATLVASNPTD